MYLQGALGFGSSFEVHTLDRRDCAHCPFISSPINLKSIKPSLNLDTLPIDIFSFLNSKPQKRFQIM